MGFRLVPKSVTLNDLEWRNGRLVCIISPNSVALGLKRFSRSEVKGQGHDETECSKGGGIHFSGVASRLTCSVWSLVLHEKNHSRNVTHPSSKLLQGVKCEKLASIFDPSPLTQPRFELEQHT